MQLRKGSIVQLKGCDSPYMAIINIYEIPKKMTVATCYWTHEGADIYAMFPIANLELIATDSA